MGIDINVLAVLDDLVADMGGPLPGTAAHQLQQVRDEVAGLVEAALDVSCCYHCADDLLGAWDALAAALARVGGAA